MAGALINAEQLLGLRELNQPGEKDFVSELIDIFCQQSPPILSELESAVAQLNFVSIEKLAHKLKGSSANIGAARLYSLCADLELQARGHAGHRLKELHKSIVSSYAESTKILRRDWYQK
jgi:HPt (histidine-containing phosphotransfer) domain-containing protein